jgi:hypothetical protein
MSTFQSTGLASNINDGNSIYNQQIQNLINMQEKSVDEIDMKNNELVKKYLIQIEQLKEIEDKEKLLLTRSRMLQISQDRNAYKKKIIYSLLTVVFAIFIVALVLYVLFAKKKV